MWFYHLTRTLGPIADLYWRLGLEGRTDLVPLEGPLIIAPNHSSFLDPWFLLWTFPARFDTWSPTSGTSEAACGAGTSPPTGASPC